MMQAMTRAQRHTPTIKMYFYTDVPTEKYKIIGGGLVNKQTANREAKDGERWRKKQLQFHSQMIDKVCVGLSLLALMFFKSLTL